MKRKIKNKNSYSVSFLQCRCINKRDCSLVRCQSLQPGTPSSSSELHAACVSEYMWVLPVHPASLHTCHQPIGTLLGPKPF